LERYLAKNAATTRAELISGLDDRRYARLVDSLDLFLVEAPAKGTAGKPGADVLPPMVAKAYRRARTAARAARDGTGTAREDALHRVRKSVKRLRYATEAVTPVAGRQADRYRRRSKKVQQVLGDHHDYVVLRGTLRELGVQTHLDGGNAFTFGLLHGRIGMATIQREHEFARRWRKLASRKARRWLHA
jgi:CHAD domain-containing protein